ASAGGAGRPAAAPLPRPPRAQRRGRRRARDPGAQTIERRARVPALPLRLEPDGTAREPRRRDRTRSVDRSGAMGGAGAPARRVREALAGAPARPRPAPVRRRAGRRDGAPDGANRGRGELALPPRARGVGPRAPPGGRALLIFRDDRAARSRLEVPWQRRISTSSWTGSSRSTPTAWRGGARATSPTC